MSEERIRGKTFLNVRLEVWVCLFFAVAIFVVYGQLRHHDFVSFDDSLYVVENSHIKRGLTLETIVWAFGFVDEESPYWHPLTWLSHALDCQLYGLNPGMHLMTNLMLHFMNTILLFLALNRMTGAIWKSAFVAALFALHPLNVESVAWIAARKNVLSTFFWMLTLLMYARYAERPGISRYLAVFLIFALGLTAKPMLVTLPCALLLLDYWPLNRVSISNFPRSAFHPLLEKIPFFCLSAILVHISSVAVQSCGEVISTDVVPMTLRIQNAVVSYMAYLGKMIWPRNLACFYPYPDMIPIWQTLVSGLLLASISVLLIRASKALPCFAVGWLWFLGTFVPVIGLMQAGLWPAMADRWAYIPLIGIFIIIAWGGAELVAKWNIRPGIAKVVAGAYLAILMIMTGTQAQYWKNSTTLYEHALEVTESYVAHHNLGVELAAQGREDEAMIHYAETLRLKPDFSKAHNNMSLVLREQGRRDEALQHLSEALRLNPVSAKAHNNMGILLAEQGKTSEAVRHFSEALHLKPEYADAHYNMANILSEQGKTAAAVRHYSEALRYDPDNADYYNNLGTALLRMGRAREAMISYQKALQLNPDYTVAENNLKSLLEDQRKGDETLRKIQEEIKLNPGNSDLHYQLGSLYKEKREMDKAIAQFQKALSIQPDFIKAMNNLSLVYAMKGNYDKALPLYKRIIALKPDNVYTYYYIARIYARQNEIGESVEWLKKAVSKGYDNWELLRNDPNFENIRNSPYYKTVTK